MRIGKTSFQLTANTAALVRGLKLASIAVASFALAAPADACDRARSRAVSRTVTTVSAPAVAVVVAAPPVVTTRTVDRVRGREVVRGVVGAPARVVRGALEVLPCPNCR